MKKTNPESAFGFGTARLELILDHLEFKKL